MSTKNKKQTGNFKYKAMIEKGITTGRMDTADFIAAESARIGVCNKPLEFPFTKARCRMTSLAHGGKPEKRDYEIGVGAMRSALDMLEQSAKKNNDLVAYMAQVGVALCGDRKLPASLIKRVGNVRKALGWVSK